MQRRYLNLDLSKLVDKLEPLDYESAGLSKYYGNVNETIEEEHSDHDEEFDNKSKGSLSRISQHSSHSSQRNRAGRHDQYFSFMSLFQSGLKIPKARSLIERMESETIAEELEEYDYERNDSQSHCFKLP